MCDINKIKDLLGVLFEFLSILLLLLSVTFVSIFLAYMSINIPISIYIILIALLISIILAAIYIKIEVKDCGCEILIALVIFIAAIVGMIIYNKDCMFHLISLLGVTALIIPLILSISSKHNIGSKLDSGEVRKSIVISLTIIYIIFLVMSFEQTLNEQPPATNGTYLLNVTYDEKANNMSQKFISIDINSASEGVLQVIPVTATANVSNGTVQITPHLSEKTGASDGGGGMIPLTGDNGTSLPADAISSFTKNFLWVYALIISFYFGSRIWEKRSDKNSIELFMKNGKSPLEIAKIRISTGNLGFREFNEIEKYLKEPEPAKIEIDNAYLYECKKNNGKDKQSFAVITIRNMTDKKINIVNIFVDEIEAQYSQIDNNEEVKELIGNESKRIVIRIKEPIKDHKYNIKIAIDTTTVHKEIEIPTRTKNEIDNINREIAEKLNNMCKQDKIEIGNAFLYKCEKDNGKDKQKSFAIITIRNMTDKKIKIVNIFIDEIEVKYSQLDNNEKLSELIGNGSKEIVICIKKPIKDNKCNIKITIDATTVHREIEIPVKTKEDIEEIDGEIVGKLNDMCKMMNDVSHPEN